MKIDYLDGIGLKQGVIAGARRVILMQDMLNRINVFPVPDSDTGTNMALTMQSVAEGAISCQSKSLSEMSQCLADSALMGARGNSGAIMAQFFQGLAEHFRGMLQATSVEFRDAVLMARSSSYEAIAEPIEGTILSVINDWAERIREHSLHTPDFVVLLKQGLEAARSSLRRTPEKLKMLARAGVVDAGGQGFVHMLEGVHHFIQFGKVEKSVGMGGKSQARARIERVPEDITFQYCTECFVTGDNIDRAALRMQLQDLGNSLIVAGSAKRVRVHIHTNQPKQVFELAAGYGEVSRQKFDDMRKQHQEAYGEPARHSIAIVTDSSCDLPPDFMIKHNIQMVPCQLSFGQDNYIDKITITPREFYRLLRESEHYPKTSQPSPGDFADTYKETLEHYEEVVAIHLSSALSGTFQAAKTARKPFPETKLYLVDSRTVSVALGLVVAEAARAVAQGVACEQVLERVRWATDNVEFYVYFDTVEYLIQGGRLSKYRGKFAQTLRLKPILTVDTEGKAETLTKTVGGHAALRKVMEIVQERAKGKRNLRFAVAHADAPERAKWLKDQIERDFETRDVMVVSVSPALGAHAGPGAAGVAFLGE